MKRIVWAVLILALIALPVYGLADGNLVVNGGFETLDEYGVPEGWSFDAWTLGDEASAWWVEPGEDGNVLRIESYQENDARVEQQVSVRGNTIYHISARVKAEGCDENFMGANLSVKNTEAVSDSVWDTQGGWQTLELYGKTSFFQSSLVVCARIGFYSEENYGSAWFDDIQVEHVDQVPAGFDLQSFKTIDFAAAPEEGEEKADWIPMFTFVAALFALAAYFAMTRWGHAQWEGVQLRKGLLVALAVAFALRLVLAVKIEGYGVDIGCFKAWSTHMAQVGPAQFYLDGYFCDYPPGYLYILWIIGGLGRLFQLTADSTLFLLMLKLPAICADLLTAYLLYRLGRKLGRPTLGALACLAYAFAPVTWLNSAMWGQMDALLVLGLLLTLELTIEKRMLPASLVYGLSVLLKPQALMFGTILLAGFVSGILEEPKKGWKALGICFASCVALMLALIVPFSIHQQPMWIVQKYASTLSSYPYATVNAMNLFALLGGNWLPQETKVLGLSYSVWGTAFLLLSLAYGLFLYFKSKDRKAIPLMCAVVLLGVFVLGVRMHERYMFPILMLLLFAALAMDDRRLWGVFAGLSVTNAINIFIVLQNEYVLSSDRAMEIVVSAANLLLLFYLWEVAFELCVLKRNQPLLRKDKHKLLRPQVLGPELPSLNKPGVGRALRFTRWDALLMLALTLVYAAFAFYRLGDTVAPQSLWSGGTMEEVVLDLGENRNVQRFDYYGEINDSAFELRFSQDGVNWDGGVYTAEMGVHDMFKWHVIETNDYARYARITITKGTLKLFEVALTDTDGAPYALSASSGGEALVDEQSIVPLAPSYMNSMYFDEVYHGRTAYEQNHNMEWYENTHPPLGKVFISWSILAFGMTPFGWRFAGTLAGVMMVPAIYYLAKLLFKRTDLSFAAAFLMTFDFMHLAQTRLGTIDSYPVLFIIMEFACMIQYAHSSFYHQKMGKTLIPLFFSGLFMGLGIASKWIGIYAGAGLAVLFATILYRRYAEYRQAKAVLAADGANREAAKRVVERFPRCALITVLCCVGFFVLVPLIIYVGSYYQFLRIDKPNHGLYEVWKYQLHMFNYHKGVFATHPFESPWWQWPLMLRPIWYYLGEYMPEGRISSIAALGNPAVWWPGLAAVIWLIVRAAQGYAKRDARIWWVLIGFCANYLPWVLVPRTTFIYHYFASVPFIILALTLYMEDAFARLKRPRLWLYGFLALVFLLFVLFYPVLTGLPMSTFHAHLLKWLPSWTLF